MRDLETLYKTLFDAGYHYFWDFDNYGNLMLRECSLNNFVDLNEYVASQEFNGCTRSIFYTDVLAVTDDKLAHAREAIAIFRSSESRNDCGGILAQRQLVAHAARGIILATTYGDRICSRHRNL
jgi:hypothetical protein